MFNFNGKKYKSVLTRNRAIKKVINNTTIVNDELREYINNNPESKKSLEPIIKKNEKELISLNKKYNDNVIQNNYNPIFSNVPISTSIKKSRKERIKNTFGSVDVKNKFVERYKDRNSEVHFNLYIKTIKPRKQKYEDRDLRRGNLVIIDGEYYHVVSRIATAVIGRVFLKLNNYVTGVFYKKEDNKNKFDKFIKAVSKDDEVERVITNILISRNIDAFRINNIINVPKNNNKINLLKQKLKKDDNNKFVSCKYTSYKANLEAKSFKDLLNLEHNDYLKENFRENSCLYTSIINKFYDRFNRKDSKGYRRNKELTYDYLLDLCEKQNKPDNNSCTIELIVNKFFKKFNFIGLCVFDAYMNLIYKHNPTDRDNIILKIMVKNRHVYELNNNLDSLSHKIDYSDELKALSVKQTFNFKKEIKKEKCEKFCNTIEEILMIIKECIKKNNESIDSKVEELFIIYLLDLETVLCHLCDSGYSPNVTFSLKLNKITFEIDGIIINIIPADNTSISNGQDVYYANIEDYKNYEEANTKFYNGLFNPEHLSKYHPSIIDIEKEYPINNMVGIFNENTNTKIKYNAVDEHKAYTQCFMSIKQIPIFSYFDVYEKYNGEEIEDLTYYIIKVLDDNIESKMLFGSIIARTYGYVLKQTRCKYEIKQFRKPYKIIDVNYEDNVKELFNNDKLDEGMKKAISNINSGMLEKGINKMSVSKIFNSYDEAHSYFIKYNGSKLLTISESFRMVDNGNNDYDNVIGNKKVFVVQISDSKELIEGFKPIKHIIYCNKKIKMLKLYKTLIKQKINVYGIRTDCLYIDKNIKQEDIKNVNFGEDIGQFEIENDKSLPDNIIKLKENMMIDFKDFSNVNIKTFEDERDTKKINKYLKKHNAVFIQGDFPGVGKTEICKNYDKEALFICPYNKLCQNMKKDNLESMTYNKAFGLYADDSKISSQTDFSKYNTIIFDEAFLYTVERLSRISSLMNSYPDKNFIATGDGLQREAIGFSNDKYLKKCLDIMFQDKIHLKEIKRLKNKKDIQVWKDLKVDIFESDLSIKEICEKHKLNMIKDIEDVKTTTNIALFNERCEEVNEHVKTNILKTTIDYYEGMTLTKNGKYFKQFYTNFNYKLTKYTKDELILFDEVDKNEIILDIKKINKNGGEYSSLKILQTHFKYPYCFTIDSIQGLSFKQDEKVTIFDSNNAYANRKYFWTAITRARKISNVNIFIHDDKEVKGLEMAKVRLYFKNKVISYKKQDSVKNRKYNDKNYIDSNWILHTFIENEKRCKCCNTGFYLFIDYKEQDFDKNVKSNFSVDRIDSNKAHTKDNCQILCNSCNSAKGNRFTHKF